ncbi:MAG: DUF2207 domain-containing protein [Saprospiraceae bacterium]|nr:DUF2207 domain-containing protein [Saprospiraceae bacterium]
MKKKETHPRLSSSYGLMAILTSIWLLAYILVPSNQLFAQNPADLNFERILNFHSDIRVDSSGSVVITETIKVNVLNYEIRRGIYRNLPTSRNVNNQKIRIQYDILSISKNGLPEPYHVETENGNKVVYMGDEDVILNPGIYTYTIEYRTYNQVGFFDDYDEIYWNVTGTQWNFPVDTVSAQVVLPDGVRIRQISCYTGGYGQTTQNCTGQVLSSSKIEWKAYGLQSNEGLTIAAGFSKGIVVQPVIPGYLKASSVIKWLGLILVIMWFGMSYVWYRKGIDFQSPAVIPQFEPPSGISPAGLGYLGSGGYKKSFISASIINAAIKGYIKINQSGGKGWFEKETYTLVRLREGVSELSSEEGKLLNGLLSSKGDEVTLDGQYDYGIASAVESYIKDIKDQFAKVVDDGNNRQASYLFFGILSLVYWISFFLIDMRYHYADEISSSIIIYFMFSFIALFIIILGYRKSRWVWILAVLAAIFTVYSGFRFSEEISAYFILKCFFALGVAGLAFFSFAVRRPSVGLLKQQADIEGFKMYLGAAENNLIRFNNPPEMTPSLFERYLPYALVLGVDDIWGKKFDKMIRDSSIEYDHNWYSGTGAFSYNFSNSLSSSLSSTINSSATQPSSSSSGSGGGGFSGGGGGGGGGGGW